MVTHTHHSSHPTQVNICVVMDGRCFPTASAPLLLLLCLLPSFSPFEPWVVQLLYYFMAFTFWVFPIWCLFILSWSGFSVLGWAVSLLFCGPAIRPGLPCFIFFNYYYFFLILVSSFFFFFEPLLLLLPHLSYLRHGLSIYFVFLFFFQFSL